MTEVPDIIRRAIDDHQRARAQTPLGLINRGARQPIARGDVRVVGGTGGNPGTSLRLCLVVGTDPVSEFADVVLVHSTPELATNIDGVVSPIRSGAPYHLVVETDLRGAVWTFQVGRLVGRLDDDALRALSAIAVGDPAGVESSSGPDIWSGPALLDESDQRWQFKKDEGRAFRSLIRDCTTVLLDGDTFWELDPELVRDSWLGGITDPAVIEDFWRWRSTRRTRPLTVTDESLRELLSDDLPTPHLHADLALEFSTVVLDFAVDVSTTGQLDQPLGARRGVVTASSLHRPAHESFDDVHFLGEQSSA